MPLKILRSTSPDFEATFSRIASRSVDASDADIQQKVASILEAVKQRGDEALVEFTRTFDRYPDLTADRLEVDPEDCKKAFESLDEPLKSDLIQARDRIFAFHEIQAMHLTDMEWCDETGSQARLLVRPLDRVGIYVPGGTAAYPSTVLMNALPAKAAEVREIIMVSPAMGGTTNPVVLAAAHLAGVDRVFSVGGAQAIGALAFGTKTVPQVQKIVGPGNAYVAEAKRQVFGTVDIDQIAGPSEVLILADASADPRVVAADMLAQAEHDTRAAALLVTWDEALALAVSAALDAQLGTLPRRDIARTAIDTRGGLILARNRAEAIQLTNRYAPEHLGLALEDARETLSEITAAGAVFVGHLSSEALGDYNAGVNHVLPTGGTARFGSPLSVHEFVKRMSVVEISRRGLIDLGPGAARLARCEGLEAHARAIEARQKGESP
jgi:histidinol dehydrogenase